MEILKFLEQLNVPNILAVIGASWWFTRDLKNDINDLKMEVKQVKDEIKDIHKEFKFVNIRLGRVEGTVYGKDLYAPKNELKDETLHR